MKGLGFIVTLAVPVVAVSALWWSQNRSLTTDERLLFSKLDAAVTHEPPRARDIIASFGLPDDCQHKSCFFEAMKIGGLRIDGGNLRQQADGIIFVLEGFSDTCIRADRVASYFDANEPEQSCRDALCWYADAQHEWGIITFELEHPNSQCVSSAVINSLPEHRLNS
ncbi:hypothetical protein [Croceicoccus mobilis]|uniref:hypothetical protein n=1 Tax=Croceicoccus mobilis TaxID=1703339 RepID=UPI0012E769AB|nr:hypothetical protein [Croceicoccus mobilis]